ncbi:hypothetical protein QR680_015309 [Steinernema hermaphroditum]|uniref:Uncharacterized protein n=1 Tax=Steinernema hermaphroditum TaxID=289476 RepID=A0AA39LKM2_9BILA|nr:hypothetical protein QR680_015309 [Steinernema hermaphroditum]
MTPDDLNSFLNYLFTGLAYSVAIPFFYIVIFKSPSAIRIYRNTILNMASWYIITIGFYSILLQPIYATLPSESCVKFAGLTSYFGREVHVAAVFLAAVSIENMLVAIIICFFYRYDQLRSINNASFLNGLKGFVICLTIHVITSIIACCIVFIIVRFGELIEHNGTFLLCFGNDNYHMAKLPASIIGVLLIIECLMSIVFACMTVVSLRSQKAHMTEWTIQLQQRLTTNLVVLLFLPIIFDVIPICILCYMVYIKSDSLYFWVSFTSHTPFWDVMLSFLATLYFVTPYRKAVKKMLWKTNVITSSNNS